MLDPSNLQNDLGKEKSRNCGGQHGIAKLWAVESPLVGRDRILS